MKPDLFSTFSHDTSNKKKTSPNHNKTNDFEHYHTNTINIQSQSPSNESYRRQIKQLQKCIKQERQKNKQLQEKLLQFQKRTLQREKEFHKIIGNMDITLAKYSNKTTQIDKLYQQINGTFVQSQKSVHQILQTRYKQNLCLMDRKISQIVQIMKVQLSKNYKLSQNQNCQLRKSIKKVQGLALQIQNVNQELVKKNNDLEFRIRILKEQKKLLIEELNQKKFIAKKYFVKAKQSEKKQFKRNNHSLYNQSERDGIQSRGKSISMILQNKPSTSTVIGNRSTIATNSNLTENYMNKKRTLNGEIDLLKINSLNSTCSVINKKQSFKMQNNLLQKIGQPFPLMNFSQQRSINNTINTLKQTLNRQKRKSIEYKSCLSLFQKKIVMIDKIIVKALGNIRDENGKGRQLKDVLDQIKNVINNADGNFDTLDQNKTSIKMDGLIDLLQQ